MFQSCEYCDTCCDVQQCFQILGIFASKMCTKYIDSCIITHSKGNTPYFTLFMDSLLLELVSSTQFDPRLLYNIAISGLFGLIQW